MPPFYAFFNIHEIKKIRMDGWSNMHRSKGDFTRNFGEMLLSGMSICYSGTFDAYVFVKGDLSEEVEIAWVGFETIFWVGEKLERVRWKLWTSFGLSAIRR
jgi:hypothetical protein